jgi:peptide/nickel transport system substrate-binding protein
LGVVYEGALAAGPGGGYRPLLAEEVPSFEGGTLRLAPFTVEFRLRRGVSFSDGRPVTSADARSTYLEAARLAREAGTPYPGFARLREVETPDERTVRLRFGEPYVGWRELLSAPILPEGEAAERAPTGTGPFLPRGASDKALSFERNERYWVGTEPPQPNLDGLTVSFGEPPEGVAPDLIPLAPGETAPAGARVSRASPRRVEVLLANSRRPVLTDGETREAVLRAAAPARERLASLAGADVAEGLVNAEGVRSSVSDWEEPYRAPSQGEATPPPAELEDLVVVYPEGEPRREEVVRALVRELGEGGVRVSARAVPVAEFYTETLPRGEFDLALVSVGPPSDLERLLPSLPSGSAEALSRSLVAFGDEGAALAEAQRVLAREAALLPLYAPPDTYAWSDALFGPRPGTPSDALLHNVREWGFYK